MSSLPISGATEDALLSAHCSRPDLTSLLNGAQPPEAEANCAPLSFAQQRLWFLDQLYPNDPAYNLPIGLRIFGPLQRAALQRSLQQLIERHEVLRTQFRTECELPVQEILLDVRLPLAFHDCSAESIACTSDAFQKLVTEEARRPFDLSNDLVIRAVLWRFSREEHFLLLTLHHIAADEWSLQVFLRDLSALYQAAVSSQKPALPDLPIQYSDFAIWQRDLARQGFFDSQIDYWKKQLKNVPRLELPADFPRAGQSERSGGRASRVLSRSLGQALTQLAQGCQVTPFMIFLAAFKVLLCRLTGQEDLAVGSPISGRTRIETEDLIGFFVNTLVLRLDAAGNPTFRECLNRVRRVTLDAFAHQELPFERLVEELQPERSAGEVPLIQVMFALESGMGERFSSADICLMPSEIHTQTAKFDLTFVVRETRSGFMIVAEFDLALFLPDTIQRWLAHYETLLEGIRSQMDTPTAALPLLSPPELHEIVERWNATDRPFPSSKSLAELFEDQARLAPDRLAICFGTTQLSYRELNERANQLAFLLEKKGVGPGKFAGIFLERSAEAIIAILAVIKRGAAYLPLDTDYPKDRIEYILRDANARVVISKSPLLRSLPSRLDGVSPTGPACLHVLLDEDGAAISRCPNTNPLARATGEEDAYLMYTSGSTGRPKGVVIPQRAVTRLVIHTDYVQLRPDDRVAQASNIAFDAATFEIWGALLNGATLIGLDKDIAITPQALARALRSEEITILFLTTALFNQIAQHRPDAFGRLRFLLFGGEAVDPKWVSAILEIAAPENLLHVYGPTETTTFAAWHRVSQVSARSKTIPIGRPIANTQIYILDQKLQPVPIGATGEIYIGGPGLARGYLNQPELTGEKFLAHPFKSGADRIYKTGDLGRYLPGGEIEFTGRADHQVKIRGYRIELGEIESALASHPLIAEAVARPVELSNGEKKLVAYWAPKTKSSALPKLELRPFLQQLLPEYMIPSAFIPLNSFPLTANGKIDRQALPMPDWTRSEAAPGYRPPLTAVEIQLAQIWEEILGVKNIGRNDNFFDLGGHSLLAVRLFSKLEESFHQTLPLATLFRAPTIASLAASLSQPGQAQRDHLIRSALLVDIQPTGSRPPIFWIHSLGGDGGGGFFYYRRLAELLGPDQPSYGIRSPAEPLASIEEMALRYLAEIRQLQPNGPYYLGGFCFGGVVAFEMARQLALRGDPVGSVLLLESAPPNAPRLVRRWTWSAFNEVLHNLIYWLGELPLRNPAQLVARVHRKRKTFQRRLSARFRRNARQDAVQLQDLINVAEYPKDYLRYAEAHWQALRVYRPQPYFGKLTLFRSRKQALRNLDPALGWTPLAPAGIDLHIVPGSHETMLQEPSVQIVAEQLQASLRTRQQFL